MDLMLILGLNKTIYQLAMVNNVVCMVVCRGERMIMSSEGH